MRRVIYGLASLIFCVVGQSVFAQSDTRLMPGVHYVPGRTYVPISTTRYTTGTEVPTPHEAVVYVRLTQVDASSRSKLDREVERYVSRQGRMSLYILLDLRDNLGGLVNGAFEVLQAFAPYPNVRCFTLLSWVDVMRPYDAKVRGPYADVHVAVLVNKKTASAAEIIARYAATLGKAAYWHAYVR